MIEYLSFHNTWDYPYYLYSLIKTAEEIINELIKELRYDPPKSHVKLIECVLTGNSKQYLGKAYIEEQSSKLSAEEVDKLFNNYEAKLSGQMVKSLGKLIIWMYSMGACTVLGMNNQDVLSEDLESHPFLNSVGPLTYPKIFQCHNGSKFKGDVTRLSEKHEVCIRRITTKYKHTHTAFVEALNKILTKQLFKIQDAQELNDPKSIYMD